MAIKFCRFVAAGMSVEKILLSVLLKQSVDDLRLLLHVLLELFEPVGFAFDMDNGTVVDSPVEDGGNDGNIGKDVVSLGKGLV